MDALVELLPLLFIGLYYLLAARRRAAKARAAREENMAPQTELVSGEAGATARETRGPTPFEAFLEQLEMAAAEAAGQPIEEPAPRPEPAPKEPRPVPPTPVPTARLEPSAPREFRAPRGSFDAVTPPDHDAHGFGPENPLSEEAFEKAPAFALRRPARERAYDPHGLHARRAPSELGPDWRRSLRDPKAAREAFVLQTIFGPRGGRKAENR